MFGFLIEPFGIEITGEDILRGRWNSFLSNLMELKSFGFAEIRTLQRPLSNLMELK